MSTNRELIVKVEKLKSILNLRATGGPSDDINYKSLRDELIMIPQLKSHLPIFLETCENMDEFWRFIQPKFEHYKERKIYLIEQFKPVLSFLETTLATPSDAPISAALAKDGLNYIHEVWNKALDRRTSDPEGAITMARTLLEGVCKHILDISGIMYENSADLPELYSMASRQINVAPSQYAELFHKKILGGCNTVVLGLDELRNSLGDAHGKGKDWVKPDPRHAELAVNLAGTMATFLISSLEEVKK